METKEERIVALLHGHDRAGIVARVSGWIYARGGNILHADQHRDRQEGIFFQRVEWIPVGDVAEEMRLFKEFAKSDLEMEVSLSRSSSKPKIVLMVSKFEHCFGDMIMRCRSGEINCEIACVISNHEDLRPLAETFGLKYHYIPVSKETKPQAEAKQLEIIRESGAELVVMARYMQILSENFLDTCSAPVINIHHSFLPAFAGAKPYHRAYERGVKLIGATAHYATKDLDEGPIIAQLVTTVSHRNNVDDLMRKGRELEREALASAVRLHVEGRILTYKNKTVIFD
ncbi:MAG: formyltetrahydrofolate deformylase [Verrucomicrobiaceae bacterium]|nr:formyltetrahydrofolate deformylase [Verrucomicrobiaceae bacterium]